MTAEKPNALFTFGVGAPTIAVPAPAGPYTEQELEIIQRHVAGENPLGWRPAGRDERGNLVFVADLSGGRRGARRRAFHVHAADGLRCSEITLAD